jgi:cohesin complex subunit SA-1/2
MIIMIFCRVFVPRFRDVHASVRNTSIESLGGWMKVYPPFIHVNHLKYLGWAMNDADPSVRHSSLISLKNIFHKWGIEEPLLLFHQRFINRILEMSQDIDSNVVSASIDLVTQLMKYE